MTRRSVLFFAVTVWALGRGSLPGTGTCYEMHGHFINMTNTSHTMVACGIATVNGQLTAVQDFQ